jgi:hypothetical protein
MRLQRMESVHVYRQMTGEKLRTQFGVVTANVVTLAHTHEKQGPQIKDLRPDDLGAPTRAISS